MILTSPIPVAETPTSALDGLNYILSVRLYNLNLFYLPCPLKSQTPMTVYPTFPPKGSH